MIRTGHCCHFLEERRNVMQLIAKAWNYPNKCLCVDPQAMLA